MGNILGGYSNSQKHCLVEFPHVETKTKEFIVNIRLQLVYNDDGTACWLVPENKYPYDAETRSCYFMGDMGSELQSNQKAIIMGIFLLMVQNELHVNLELPIRKLFHVDDNSTMNNTKKKVHPDMTGKISILFDSEQRGIQSEDKQMLYESTAENDGALKYAGLEQRLLEPRSIPINSKGKEEETETEFEEEKEEEYEMFTDEDESIKFILQNKEQFTPTRSEMYKIDFEEKDLLKDITYYHVSKDFLSKVRKYFKDAIFPFLHYTTFTETRLSLELSDDMMQKILALHPKPEKNQIPAPSLFFTLQFNYIIITTGGAKVGPKVFKRHYN